MMERLGISDASVVRQEIERNDAAHVRTMSGLFGLDWEDPLGLQAQVREGPFDHRRIEDRREDLELTTAVRAVLEVDLEDPLEQSAQLMRAGRQCTQSGSVAVSSDSPVAREEMPGS
ncbi:MAG: hypothetical protein H0U56_02840 [Methylibium sp.]|nr:hypothetical protein [Methylibium sp.]